MSIFSHVKTKNPSTNTFDLSHDRKFSMNMGELVPTAVLECVPGDNFHISTAQMLRFAPMIAPVMHRVNVYTHFFFVPNRILWSNWESFITGGEDGDDASVFPQIRVGATYNISNGDLLDYLGLPSATVNPAYYASAVPSAAYQAIYSEFYRDQNLIAPIDYKLIDGEQTVPQTTALNTLRKRAWQHDYFTSALPWTQKGSEATIPLGSVSPNYLPTSEVVRTDGNVLAGGDIGNIFNNGPSGGLAGDLHSAAGNDIRIENLGQMNVDATTINELRRAFKLQEWLELNARGGSRYTESILMHFGVHTGDARLQRPEFLGGASSPVSISEVLQTSSNASEPTPQANMAGHGISVGSANNINYSCKEHGYIIGIMSVMPKTAYQQGVPKHFTKFDKFDYYWKSFSHLGEQAILQQELYIDLDASGTNEDVFGYTPRYAEYKYMNSSVHGELRTSLDFWHMGRIFSTTPNLNQTFIEANPTDRIFAVTDAEKLYVHLHHSIKARRKMPYFGTPTI